jgi:Family of unknown function (DUF6055)
VRRLLALAAVLLGLSASPAYAYPGVLDESLSTEHFVVHWTSDLNYQDGDHVITRQQAGDFAANAEWAYDTYVTQWGYPPHVADADGKIDVYVYKFERFFNEPEFGTLAAGSVPATANDQSAGWIEVNKAFVSDPQVAAHQTFNMIQMAIYAPAPDWLAQSTAEWAAFRLREYPSPFVFHSPDNSLDCNTATGLPWVSVWLQRPCGLEGYESSGYTRWTFFQYLQERFGPDTIKDVWTRMQAVGSPSYGVDAIRDVLAGKSASLTDVFGDYTTAMLTGSFATSLLAGVTPGAYASVATGRENGSVPTLRVPVNRLAARFLSLAPPAADEKACYAATLSLTVTLPASVSARPHVYATGTRTLTPLSVDGSTASASIPWDTCSSEAPALLSLPNTSQTLDGRMFVVNASVSVDKSKIVSPTAPPPGATISSPVIDAPTEDPAPDLAFYSRTTMKVSSTTRVLQLVFFSSGSGRVRVMFSGQQVALLKVRAGANRAEVRLPKPAKRYSASSRAVLELTALSPAGAPGETSVQRVAFVKPKTKRSGR